MGRKKPKQSPNRVLGLPESGFRQECRPQHSSVSGVQTILSICNRRFCGVVLL
jgi:hypothetical protein